MSSFVIGKKHFMRVAGLVAGIADACRYGSKEFWIYDYEKERNMISDDYLEKFAECYNLNVESVCKQYSHDPVYGNPDTYKDDNNYDADFNLYYKYGKKVCCDTMFLMDVVWELILFSRSVNYQIEDMGCNAVVMEFLNLVIVKITQIADLKDERDSWGSFDLGLDKEPALK